MDLNAPLGMIPPPKPRRRAGLVVGFGFAAVTLIAAGLIIALSDPHAGEPTAMAIVPPETPVASERTTDLALSGLSPKVSRADQRRDSAVDRTPTGSLPSISSHEGDTQSFEHGVRVVRSPPLGTSAGPSTPGPLIIDVSRALDAPPRKPGPGTILTNPATANVADGPKIAIFVSGMGLDESATRTAIEVMPSAVSLAFLPYGKTLGSLVEAAKTRGHEVLLQLPMQNRQGDTLGSTQGPHSLAVGHLGPVLAEDLDWLLARFSGYDGVTNLLGAAVTSDASAMTAVLKAVGGRHLFYLDDGTSKRSQAVSVGASLGVPTLQADIVLDATADPALVRANLDSLVAIARRKGRAIGMASGLPDHLAAIARFAGELRGQGISLVPVNALAGATNAPSATSAR